MENKRMLSIFGVLAVVAALITLAVGAVRGAGVAALAREQPANPRTSTLVVTSASDTGAGTLRRALQDAQSADTIVFDTSVFPPTSPVTLTLNDQLPDIAVGNLTIDGSDAGVVLDGSQLVGGSGLRVASSSNVIRGLEVYSFPEAGIWLASEADHNVIGGDSTLGDGPTGEGNVLSDNGTDGIWIAGNDNVVKGNFIGTDPEGRVDRGNASEGVRIHGGAHNLIGGAGEGEGNVLSGNGDNGVWLHVGAHDNHVVGNLVGTNADGTEVLPNDGSGVAIAEGSHDNVVGSDAPGQGNVIAGNSGHDVALWGGDTTGNVIIGNLIGTDANGTASLRAHSDARGIFISAPGNTVGGPSTAERNVINDGIHIHGEEAEANVVIGNYVGLGVDGTTALGGNWSGVGISDGAANNRVGGAKAEERNVISGNSSKGIYLFGGAHRNTIVGNYVGTDAAGTEVVPNEDGIGIAEGSSGNVVGGEQPGQGNLISGNGQNGVGIYGRDATSNTIAGNIIGTDVTGSAPLGNGENGVFLGSSSNVLGGQAFGAGNVIADNAKDGVLIWAADHNTVAGNLIGTDASGKEDLGNTWSGVTIASGASHNQIERNVISGNGDGFEAVHTDTVSNRIVANVIGSDSTGTLPLGNDKWGIYLVSAGQNDVISNVVSHNQLCGVIVWESDGVNLRGNTIVSNTAGWGSGCYVGKSDGVVLEENDVYSNTATRGAGIVLNQSPSGTLRANNVYGNVAEESGGGVVIDRSPAARLIGNDVQENVAGLRCAGLYLVDSGRPRVDNTIVAGNRVAAGYGSGMCVEWDTDAHLRHNTIAANWGGDGSGVHASITSTVALTNTILVSHAVGITVGHGCSATLDHTLWASDTEWANAVDWVNNGALRHASDLIGHPAFVDPGSDDYHLGPGSAAVDAGTATGVREDLDGDPRPMGLRPDVGADEAWRTSVALPLALKDYAPGVQPPQSVVSAAFVYQSPPDSIGWTSEHDRGRRWLESELGDGVVTTHTHDVAGGAEPVLRQYAEDDWDIIFATSYGLGEAVQAVVEDFPDVAFEHCSGSETGSNLATYFGRMYQPRYLSGVVAGAMTESDLIGYVAPFQFIPEVVRGIDAFALGVRHVNPDAEIRVAWSGAWYDPSAERQAAEGLLDAGADVIAQHQDTLEPQEAAQERGAWSIGYQSDMRPMVGDSVLTSLVWDWGAYYVDTVQDVRRSSWVPHAYWGGLADGVVELASFSPLVPQDVLDQVESERQRIVEDDWDVFCGPINDADGTQRVAPGECLTNQEMLEIDWFVEGVTTGEGRR